MHLSELLCSLENDLNSNNLYIITLSLILRLKCSSVMHLCFCPSRERVFLWLCLGGTWYSLLSNILQHLNTHTYSKTLIWSDGEREINVQKVWFKYTCSMSSACRSNIISEEIVKHFYVKLNDCNVIYLLFSKGYNCFINIEALLYSYNIYKNKLMLQIKERGRVFLLFNKNHIVKY